MLQKHFKRQNLKRSLSERKGYIGEENESQIRRMEVLVESMNNNSQAKIKEEGCAKQGRPRRGSARKKMEVKNKIKSIVDESGDLALVEIPTGLMVNVLGDGGWPKTTTKQP